METPLEGALSELQRFVNPGNSFAVAISSNKAADLNALAKRYDDSQFLVSLKALETSIAPLVKKVEKQIGKLKSRHKAEVDAGADNSQRDKVQ